MALVPSSNVINNPIGSSKINQLEKSIFLFFNPEVFYDLSPIKIALCTMRIFSRLDKMN